MQIRINPKSVEIKMNELKIEPTRSPQQMVQDPSAIPMSS